MSRVYRIPGKHLRIVGDGSPTGTRVLMDDGTEVPGVTSVSLVHAAGDLPKVNLTVIDTGKSEVVGILDKLEREHLPPPLPKPEIQMHIGSPERRFLRRGEWRHWRLERFKPLGTFGGAVTSLASGWLRVSDTNGIDDMDEFITLTCEDLP